MDLAVSISQFLANASTNADRATAVAGRLSKQIELKEIKLIDLVKALGDYLTAEDDLLRPKATQCLSATLAALKKDALTPNDLAVLTGFYCSKIEDAQSVKETLFGLSSLVEMESFGPSNLTNLLQALQAHYVATEHLASTRYYALLTLKKIFDKFSIFIQKSQSDRFIECFLSVSTGEKDPRNLLLSFALNGEISSTLAIDDFADELFDTLFCYFPISFKPPKDDPYKITSAQLKQQLRKGIASSPKFAKDSYPNLLEKLTSTSPSVKRDTVETIAACISNYGHNSLVEHWVEIWSALKFEIIHGEEEDEEGVYQQVLDVFKAISTELSKSDDDFDKFLNTLLSELKENFQLKTVKQTCNIFGAVARANAPTYNKVVKECFPELLRDAKELSVPKERTLIQNIGVFTNAYVEVYGTFDNPKLQDYNNGLKLFKDDILIILGKSLMSSSKVEVSLRTLAIAELTKLITLSDFLTNSELGLIVQYFTETVLVDDNEYVFNSAIGGLIQVSRVDSGLLLEITLPTLLSLTPDDDSSVIVKEEAKPKEKVFEILKSVCTNGAIVSFLLIRLLNKLESVQIGGDVEYSQLIVSSLEHMIATSQTTMHFSTDSHLTKSFTKLVELLLQFPTMSDDNIMESSTEVLKLLVVYSSKKLHQQLLDETLAVFTGQSLEITYYHGISPINILQWPSKFVNIPLKVLAAVDKSTKVLNPYELIDSVVRIIKTSKFEDVYTKISYLRLLALLINKWCDDASRYELMDLGSSADIEVYAWIARGVILKIDPRSNVYIERLALLLPDETYGEIAAKSFEILVVEMTAFDKFKKITNNNVRLLYKQRFFNSVSPKLVQGFYEATDLKVKSNYLAALSLILKHTKREIIAPHLSSFFPLLLQSLALPNADVRLASLQTILSSVDEIADLIGSHLSTLVPKLLTLIQIDESHLNNAEVRGVAVKCLHSFTLGLPLEKLVPYQKEIIKALTPVLDDKKRSVRKAAVDARQAYYELGRTVD